MKKLIVMVVGIGLGMIGQAPAAKAQEPISEIIKAGVVKVIKAIDLQVQRQQNKVIWMQNAQKTMENAMSQQKLGEISGWVEKQRALYKAYYEELYRVKTAVADYQRIRDIISRQGQLMAEYQRAWRLFQQDEHFSPEELKYMAKVYSGILQESAKNLDRIFLVVEPLATQMNDAQRRQIIQEAAGRVETNYFDLKMFNQQQVLLSMQRAKARQEVEAISKLYGLP